jgi:hypothetical protein
MYMRARACSVAYPPCNAMRHIVKSFVAALASPYISTLFHKRTIVGKKVVDHKMCVLIVSTTCT